jgi:phosphate transport system substrate-binding protein
MSTINKAPTALLIIFVALSQSAGASAAINGAASTFIYPVFAKWVEVYRSVTPDIQFDYQSVGSLQGVDRLLTHSADFAASDTPLHLEQINEPSCSTLYFPAVVGAVVVVYNLPQLSATTRIRLNGQVLGDIYLGKIHNWNDPPLVALNPGTALYNQTITVNNRIDSSGTTFTFTDYLSKANAQWAKEVGAGMVAQWPIGVSENGNKGANDAVKSQAGAIGYVELSYALTKDLPMRYCSTALVLGLRLPRERSASRPRVSSIRCRLTSSS